ncbi:MAG TPA: TrmJ/YjtD family RNA methyltransferase [Bryobacteraceae bacterium]|nr:TrmJ/YjtD family RNA methyltransferase [Bryobacteraceae bacterium]
MMKNSDRLRIVLVSPRNPLNIGAAARAMSNFGFSQLRVVNAYDVAYQEARSAVNASAILASSRQYSSVAEAVADCTLVVGTTSLGNRELQHSMRRLEYGGKAIRKAVTTGSVALLFGSEKFGLSNDDMSHCHWLMRIPTRDEHESMNLGQAVAVCLYELIRSGRSAESEPREVGLANAEERERFTTLLLESLRESGYMQDLTAASSENKLRRMVVRLGLKQRDAFVWLGMFRQILWKLRHRE